MLWKKGAGKLGIFAPLLGTWVAETDSPQGRVKCERAFSRVLGNNYISLKAFWFFGASIYEEQSLFGYDRDKKLKFWSFTSDGKQSQGELVEATDVHPKALAFIAEMPAGIARQIYWPGENGLNWAVESQTKKGWNRFTEHHYTLQGNASTEPGEDSGQAIE